MSDETVRNARDRYLHQNSLGVDSYTDTGFPIYVGRWTLRLPNPGFLHLHDLHHVVTGYGTGLVGEAEVSAFELRAGCKISVLGFCFGAIFFGMFISPKRILRAWQRARGTQSLYDTLIKYETLLDMRVADLRQHLGIPREGFK